MTFFLLQHIFRLLSERTKQSGLLNVTFFHFRTALYELYNNFGIVSRSFLALAKIPQRTKFAPMVLPSILERPKFRLYSKKCWKRNITHSQGFDKFWSSNNSHDFVHEIIGRSLSNLGKYTELIIVPSGNCSSPKWGPNISDLHIYYNLWIIQSMVMFPSAFDDNYWDLFWPT